jgi:hypothetical protein
MHLMVDADPTRTDQNPLHHIKVSLSIHPSLHPAPNRSPQTPPLHPTLSMNTILYMRINPYHLRPQLRVLPHKDLRIPSSGDEERIDPARDRR